MDYSHITLVIVQSEKGGCGKTTSTDAIVAGLSAGGRRVLVVDADDGNSGYIQRCGKGSASPLEWTTGADQVNDWLDAHLRGRDVIVIDCGANIIASGARVNEFLGTLIMRIKEGGGKVIPIAVASTNAPGTDRLVREMRDAFGDYAQVRLLRNNQDGSGAFAPTLTTLGMEKALFPHLASGIVSVRLSVEAPLLDLLAHPPSGYRLAMATYAQAVAQFVSEAALASLFPAETTSAMAALAKDVLGPLHYVVRTLAQASDAALTANRKVFAARRALRQVARDGQSDAAIARAALIMIDAEDAYASITA